MFCAPFLAWGPNFNPNPFPPQANDEFFRFYGIPGNASNLDWLLDPYGSDMMKVVRSWQPFRMFPTFLVFIAGLLSFAYSILPGRRRWWAVFVLVLSGLTAIWLRLLVGVYSSGSVLEPVSERLVRVVNEAPFLVVALGAGWHATLLGMVLLTLGLILQRRGLATVPVRFAATGSSNQGLAYEMAWFSVIVLGAVGTLSVAVNALSLSQLLERFGSQGILSFYGLTLLIAIVSTGLPAFCGWALFADTWKHEVRGLFRSCGGRFYGVAMAIPVLILAVSRLVQFIVAEPSWRVDWRSAEGAPWGALFVVSLGYFPLALLEELGWRGFLQPRLTRLFGLGRGLFLVGLLWGACHLPGDLASTSSLGRASHTVLVRLAVAIASSVPLAWFLLRTRSILPGSVMHGTINYLHFTVVPLLAAWDWGGEWIGVLLWSVVGYVMFKRWPQSIEAEARPTG